MTNRMLLPVGLLAVAGAGVLWSALRSPVPRGDARPSVPAVASASQSDLSVTALMRNADLHRGPIWVQGVVSAASKKDQLLALIDVSEYEDCATATCAALYLPVHWEGEMPNIEDRVRVRGEVEKRNGRTVFAAAELRRFEAEEANR